MSIDNLIAATEAMNALTARMTGFMDGVDDDLAAHQAAYAALAGDLAGAVSAQMYFTAVIDPDEAAPTNTDGGTFVSIAAAVAAAPASAYVYLELAPGKIHLIDTMISPFGRKVFLMGNSTDKPTVRVSSYATAGYNFLNGFYGGPGFAFYSENCDILLDDKTDVGLPWASQCTMFRYSLGEVWDIAIRSGTVTGPVDLGIVYGKEAEVIVMRLNSVILDGASAVFYGTGAVTLLSTKSVTLQNGAVLNPGGTTGDNYLNV